MHVRDGRGLCLVAPWSLITLCVSGLYRLLPLSHFTGQVQYGRERGGRCGESVGESGECGGGGLGVYLVTGLLCREGIVFGVEKFE